MKDGMDLSDILKRIRQGRKTIYRSLGVAFVLALLMVLLTPKKYTTKVILLSETSAKSGASGLLGQLGNLSSMNLGNLVGLNLNNSGGTDVLLPEVYPDVVSSTPFLLDVMHQTITDSKKGAKPMTVSDYLKKHSKPSIIGRIASIFKSSNKKNYPLPVFKNGSNAVLHLSKEQSDRLRALSDMIQVNVRKPDNKLMSGDSKILSVEVEAHDPLISALLADSVVSCLKKYVINYNIHKAKKDYEFVSEQFDKARKNYYAAQQKLGDFMDSHTNVILSTVRIEEERLRQENNLYANVYTSLAQMKEKAKIQVQDHTPVFTIIEPAKVPIKKSAPKTSLIILGMLLVGGFVGVAIEVIKIMLHPGKADL